jgi:prophage regulatory protein
VAHSARNDATKALLVVSDLGMPCPEVVASLGSATARPLVARDVEKSLRDYRRTWDFSEFAITNIDAGLEDDIMNERIIRLPQVRELVGLGRSAIYGKIKAGDFPKPVKFGRVSGLVQSEVQSRIDSKIIASRGSASRVAHVA